jgi:hypothetical protein
MKIKIAFIAGMVPGILAAQAATATTATTAEAVGKVGKSGAAVDAQATTATTANADIPASYSAESKAKLNATFAAARERKLPDRPIRDRIAEGQAKGATEAQVVLAAQRTEARLEAAQSALVRAGRQPGEAELIRAEAVLARGGTVAQIESAARAVQPDQPVIVQLDAIAGANANVNTPGAGVAAGATGAGTTAGAAGVTGAATVGVGAVIKKPPM